MVRIYRAIGWVLIGVASFASQTWAQDRRDPFRSDRLDAGPQANRISSVDLVDTPVTTVFKMISDLTGWSIFMSPEVSEKPPKINLWIKNLTPDQVMDRVCSLAE
ncbi:MAG: hypothetical protein ACM359_03065, partial [Bacillota bacterium]